MTTSPDVAVSQDEPPRARDWAALLAPVLAGVIAVPGAVSVLEAAREGRGINVFWGQLAALGVLTLMVSATLVLFGRLLRHRTLFVVSLVVGGLLMVVCALALHTVAFRVPAVVAALLDAALLAWSVVGVRRLRGSAGAEQEDAGAPPPGADTDTVADAGTGPGNDADAQVRAAESPAPSSVPPAWSSPLLDLLLDCLFVVLALLLCLLTLLGY